MQDKEELRPSQIKNLSELKKLIKPGTEIKTLAHKYHPEAIGLIRVVTEVHVNFFYSKIKDQPEHEYSICNHGKGFRTDIEKASEYIFDEATVKVLDSRAKDGSVLYEMEFYDCENAMFESDEETGQTEDEDSSFVFGM